jgi:hypothetical protein
MVDKIDERSNFQEIRDSAAISPGNLERGSEAPLQDFDGIEEVPFDDKWSWNPVDWYYGIKHELTTFSLEITEQKRVVSYIH